MSKFQRETKRFVSLVGVVLACLSSQAEAQSTDYNSANHYLPACRAADRWNVGTPRPTFEETLVGGQCLGIVSGILGVAAKLVPEFRSCPPNGSNAGQALKVVLNYLDGNPSQLHLDFRALIVMAYREAWPCR